MDAVGRIETFLRDAARGARFQRRSAVPEQVVRNTESRVDLLPVHNVCRWKWQIARRSILRRARSICIIGLFLEFESNARANGHTPDPPAVLQVEAEIVVEV